MDFNRKDLHELDLKTLRFIDSYLFDSTLFVCDSLSSCSTCSVHYLCDAWHCVHKYLTHREEGHDEV